MNRFWRVLNSDFLPAFWTFIRMNNYGAHGHQLEVWSWRSLELLPLSLVAYLASAPSLHAPELAVRADLTLGSRRFGIRRPICLARSNPIVWADPPLIGCELRLLNLVDARLLIAAGSFGERRGISCQSPHQTFAAVPSYDQGIMRTSTCSLHWFVFYQVRKTYSKFVLGYTGDLQRCQGLSSILKLLRNIFSKPYHVLRRSCTWTHRRTFLKIMFSETFIYSFWTIFLVRTQKIVRFCNIWRHTSTW